MKTKHMSKMRKKRRLIYHHADFDFATWPDVSVSDSHEVQREGIMSIVNEIDDWHLKRWRTGLGYHLLIGNGHGIPDGMIVPGRPIKYQGAHAKHHNHDSIGILVIGDLEKHDPTGAQVEACAYIASILCFMNNLDPLGEYSRLRYMKKQKGMIISGHKDWPEHSTNECPGRLSKYLPRIRERASELLFSQIVSVRYTPR